MLRPKAAALALALTAVWFARAAADMPYPSNPAPCPGSETDPPCIDPTAFAQYLFLPATTPLTLPNDFAGGDAWKLTSAATGNAAIDANPQELFGVTGASVDRAWQTTTGRPDVLIAVLDSGIRWAEPQPDLINKFYLNRAELPLPQGSTNTRDAYDRNDDGLFNIADYLADDTHGQDSRVSDQNGNGVIDPEDLIFLFSDGVDDDANGYIDDISGWDFFEDDNDPLDEVRYGHGTGESRDSASEANNGGGVGTCPNCLLLEVRVGDSFVAEANAFAQGVVFAVDSGARVVQEALGTLNNTSFGQQAVDYAYHNGVVVIASAADEESSHHNYPANYNHTVQVNSVTRYADLAGFTQSPPSYLYLNGCTNYGAHIALSVASSSCSSEATGLSSGMAGLVLSAALNAIDRGMLTPYPRDDGSPAPFPLSAEEIKQILIQTADDINFDARDDVTPPLPQNYSTVFPPIPRMSERFHSIAGFDQYFGYGRVNADRAVLRVASGQIPPEAAIERPAWFDVVDPGLGSLTIVGRVAANRAASYRYVLEVAPGVQPEESDFEMQGGATDLVDAQSGALGVIDLAALAARMPRGVEGPATTEAGLPDPDRFTFTVRVRVIDDEGNVAEDRRALALHHDPDLLPGFPLALGGDGASAAVTADLDGDGIEEIVIGSSDGIIHAFRADTTELPGWPVRTDGVEIHDGSAGYSGGGITTPVRSAVLAGVSVGDLDRDTVLEVVATDVQGRLYVWGADGLRRPGFPVTTRPEYSFSFRSERDLDTPDGQVPDRTNRHNSDNRVGRALLGGAALGNLDGSPDGSLEIVAGAFDRHIYAWHHDGTPVLGWPVLLKDPAKVASVDPVTNEVALVAGSGARIGTKIIVPPSLGDLDGDGGLEVVAVVNEEYVEPPNAVFENGFIRALQATGVLESGNTRVYALYADGVAHGDSTMTHGWNPIAFLPGWPVKTALLTTELLPTVGTGSNGPPALADVDGDGAVEVATMSAIGPLYVLTGAGVSFFGRHDGGEDRTLDSEALGAGSNSTDTPTFGGLGALTVAEFGGAGQGFHVVAPAAGLGKLLDNQIPARQFPAENQLGAWSITDAAGAPSDGRLAPAYPRVVNDLQFLAGPAVADIDGDGLPEAIEGSGVYDVHAVDINGVEAPGWPKFTHGWMVQSPAVGDINGDGDLEVVGSTREGKLFVWQTEGDECGFIPWRRWHHDEWGSGNYHTDARPPAALQTQDVTPEPTGPTTLRLDLARVPGDDLFCGTATFDVRVSEFPITDDASFADALPLMSIEAPAGSRGPGAVLATDDALPGRQVYFGLIVRDDAGNRSALVTTSLVQFPEQGPATATPTPTPTETTAPSPTHTALPKPTNTAPNFTATPTVANPTSTATSALPATATATAPHTRTLASTATATTAVPASATATVAIATSTATVPATATARTQPTDDGCAVVAPHQTGTPWWVLFIPTLLIMRRRGLR
jgi:hypothetical protein